MNLENFWEGYDATLARVRAERPQTLPALAEILNAFQPPSAGVAFFGNNADDVLAAALHDAGWQIFYIEDGYLWDGCSKDGEWIHYVEGDIYPGRWQPPREAQQ